MIRYTLFSLSLPFFLHNKQHGNLKSLCIWESSTRLSFLHFSSSLHRCSFLSLFFLSFFLLLYLFLFFFNIIFRPYYAFPYPILCFSLLLSSAIAYHFLSSSFFFYCQDVQGSSLKINQSQQHYLNFNGLPTTCFHT